LLISRLISLARDQTRGYADGMDISRLLIGLGITSALSMNQINAETILIIVSSLSLLQLVVLKIRGYVLIDWVRLESWKGKLPFYIIKCNKHGYQLSYPVSYSEVLLCPKCINSPQF